MENQMKTHHQHNTSVPVAALPPSPLSVPTPQVANIAPLPEISRPKSESNVEVSRLREEYKTYVNDLLDWTAAQEGLDIYQLNAFYTATHEIGYYWRNYWRTCCVQFIQTAGLAILLYHDWLEGTVSAELGLTTETKGFCDTKGALDLKLLAFFLLSFLSIRLSDQIASMTEYGLYSWGDKVKSPHFVNWGWITYGLIINYITLVSSFFISGLVVYNARTPLDMILDFVALYFIIELDDEMVTFRDYKDIEEWLQGEDDNDNEHDIENRNDIDSPYEVWLYSVAIGEHKGLTSVAIDEGDDDEAEYNEAGSSYVADTVTRIGSAWNECGMNTMRKIAKCRDPKIGRHLMLPLVILMPVYVLVCY